MIDFKKLKIISKIFLMLFFVMALMSCEKKQEQKEIIRPVKTMVVGDKVDTAIRNFPGKVKANKEAKLSFEIPGSLVELPIQEGDKVKEGGLIAKLDPEKYQRKVEETKASYFRTKADYERGEKLVGPGYISRSDFDRLRSEYLMAKANYDTALRDLKNTSLYAPFAGVISKKYVDNYEKVKAKQEIALLQIVNQLDVEIFVPEDIILNLKKSDPAKINLSFEGAPSKNFPVQLKEFSAEADPDTQTYRVVFTLPAPTEINVLPGMTATIHVPMPDYQSSSKSYYKIPSTAVFDGPDNQPSVWLIDKNTMAVKRVPVEITRLDQKYIHVISGISTGDIIVTAGVQYLQEGQKVKFLKNESNQQP